MYNIMIFMIEIKIDFNYMIINIFKVNVNDLFLLVSWILISYLNFGLGFG